jgi:hypothetical protein
MNTSIWQRLQNIDRRVIYGLLIAIILIPLFLKDLPMPIIPDPTAQQFHDVVEKIAAESPDKLVIIDGEWSPSTRGENRWQSEAIINHLMQKHLRFALLSFDPQNPQMTEQIVRTLAVKYHYTYGVDYVNWGYRPFNSFEATLMGLVNNIPGTIKKDSRGANVASLPVMHNVRNIKDVSAIVEITPSGTVASWIGLVAGANHTPILYAPTAIMAPSAYPYLDSGQIAGLLTGVKGAGDYEKLTGAKSFGTRATGALSFVYGLIIVLVILGNLGYHLGRAAERRAA